MVQNLFNHLELVELAQSKAYRAYCLDWQPSVLMSLRSRAVSVILRFVSLHDEVAFDVHAYLSSDLQILGSGMLDPKSLILNREIHIVAFKSRPIN